jgi:hypothetical protein
VRIAHAAIIPYFDIRTFPYVISQPTIPNIMKKNLCIIVCFAFVCALAVSSCTKEDDAEGGIEKLIGKLGDGEQPPVDTTIVAVEP